MGARPLSAENGSPGCGGCGGAPTGKSKLRPDGEAELLELGNAEKNSLASRAMVDSSGKLAGGLTPVTSGPVGLPCRLLVVNWVVMIFVHLHII